MSVIFSRSCPLLHLDTPDPLGGWDLLLGRDKGTYDAIALEEKDASGGSPLSGYPMRASRLLREAEYFLITCEPQRAILQKS